VTPSDSITYTLTATGPGGSADASVHITVSAPPPPPVAHQPTLQEIFDKEVKDAFFEYDKADIRRTLAMLSRRPLQFLRAYPQVKVVIEGHCDERGSTEYNLALGDRRAAAAKQFLVSLGISADRMETVSYGKEKSVLLCFHGRVLAAESQGAHRHGQVALAVGAKSGLAG
jgi:peptidoglycan-associated lipoprotein